mmetsp:Transcript_15512/g.13922  ORF Transcript_15512/g.13922 Transcript_15512/m.13922 type:complete len:186 (-) Transcript_15512:103-660(-)|eukprot:CAMPEP_0201581806 /NCGR_PEP_ID=MMETSP0190_2-20130828/75337_1 /ASSEMBLY_ACC=CAM_ASM_000263 /TAXON_ID=37353 /ORGANISM="Rosalina sp." /LENGTH=185 /DNA_ID=CAMNT_0048020495 /DNA_START=99 /DNA_END=656 /DNA_ORIENTATION=-
MKSSFTIIVLLIVISFINIIHSDDGSSTSSTTLSPSSSPTVTNDNNQNNNGIAKSIASTSTPSTLAPSTPAGFELDTLDNITDITFPTPETITESEAEEITGGGVWSSIGLIAVVICGCICLERLYSSCKKVYQKRTGRYGFSRLHNQTFNEFEDDDDDDDEQDENLGVITTRNRNTKNSDQDSV